MAKHFLLYTLFAFLFTKCSPPTEEVVISFGSCSFSTEEHQLWPVISTHKPDTWIWLGDIVYGDTEHMPTLKKKYDLQKNRNSYKELIQATKVYGTWDDHDYGINDGGKEYPQKDSSKALLFQFLDVPKSNPAWQRNGVYQSYSLKYNQANIKLILLDTRYFRDPLQPDTISEARYIRNQTGTILGESQWKWLENEFHNASENLIIIGSSIQFLASEQNFEKWDNFPNEREKMLRLLKKFPGKKTIFISGDRHIGEISKLQLNGLDYTLYDITSSGLTHTWHEYKDEPNQYRLGKQHIKKNFGVFRISPKGEVSAEIWDDQNILLEKAELFTL